MKFEKAMVTIIEVEEDIITGSGVFECNTVGSAYSGCGDPGFQMAAECTGGSSVKKGTCTDNGQRHANGTFGL